MSYRDYSGFPGRKTAARLTALLFAIGLFVQPLAVAAATPDIVNIANTNASGVSVNKVAQFNVGTNGAVLVNSATSTTSVLAGTVAGNANLTKGPASIIVFQVAGGASSLNGVTEIAGQKAAFILANPNGINVNGGSFINAGRVVLTTGTPVYGGNGSLTGFKTGGGQIAVGELGLDATGTDRLDLISRALAVNGTIYANELNVVAGANNVNYNTLATQSLRGTGTAPAVAIDVSALGGMYAGKITLVATEQGVGVNNAGAISASTGNLVVTTTGKIKQSGGSMFAGGNIALKASSGDIINSDGGSIFAIGDISVTTPGSFVNNSFGNAAALGAFTVTAATVDNSGGSLSAGGNFIFTLGSAGSPGSGYNGYYGHSGHYGYGGCGSHYSYGDRSGQPSTATAGRLINTNFGSISAGNDLIVTVAAKATATPSSSPVYAVDNAGGSMSAGRNAIIAVSADSAKSSCGTPATGTVYAVNNAGGFLNALSNLTITAQDSAPGSGSSYSYSTKCGGYNQPSSSTSKTSYLVTNAGGTMSAGNDIAITVQGVTLTQVINKTRCGGGTTVVTAPVTVDNVGGTIDAQNNLTIATKGAVDNAGGELSGQNTVVRAFNVQNAAGTIEGDASVTIVTQKAFDTKAGTVTGGTVIIPTKI